LDRIWDYVGCERPKATFDPTLLEYELAKRAETAYNNKDYVGAAAHGFILF